MLTIRNAIWIKKIKNPFAVKIATKVVPEASFQRLSLLKYSNNTQIMQ